jgi:hypothetical protein
MLTVHGLSQQKSPKDALDACDPVRSAPSKLARALQYLTGVILSWWSPVSGHPPAEAYETAFGLSVVLQLIALLWFLVSARLATIPRFSASRRSERHTYPLGARSRQYAIAGLAIASHIAAARAQAAHWRLIGIGRLLPLCGWRRRSIAWANYRTCTGQG